MSFADPEVVMQDHMILIQVLFGTFNILMINAIILPVLFLVVFKSGETERRIIRDQLSGEAESVVSTEAMRGVNADRRFRSRSIAGASRSLSRATVQLQNELAFTKAWVSRRNGNAESDRAVAAIRKSLGRKGY
jgi:hypothetical protein